MLEYQKAYDKIVEKSCICVGLGTGTLLYHELDTRLEGEGISVCPGPNMAYIPRGMNMEEITDHIYGRKNVIERNDRPNLFIKKLSIYLDYFKNLLDDFLVDGPAKQKNRLKKMLINLRDGIGYYKKLFSKYPESLNTSIKSIAEDLDSSLIKLERYDEMIQ